MAEEKIKVLLGPTAAGKSARALELAQKTGSEIISADSMQVYRLMNIGTAKPSAEERRLVPHHLIDVVNPDENFTVVDWLTRTAAAIEDIRNRKKIPIIVGGTGFYFKALFEGLDPPPATDPATREKVRDETKELGPEKLFAKLKTVDPDAAGRLHPNDVKRVGRALEVFYLTGRPMSSQQKKIKLPYEYEITFINLPRPELYKKIEERIDRMIDRGLVEEVRILLARGYHRGLPALQALGYKETVDYLDGRFSYEEYLRLFKQKTRNFAKRQMTWFRRFLGIACLPIPE